MDPLYARKFPWGLVFQYGVIVIVALVLIRFISTNFIGILAGLIAGSALTARHYRAKIAQAQVWNQSGAPDSVYYRAGGYPGTTQYAGGQYGHQQLALPPGQDEYGHDEYDQDYYGTGQAGYGEQYYDQTEYGGPAYPDQHHGGHTGHHYPGGHTGFHH